MRAAKSPTTRVVYNKFHYMCDTGLSWNLISTNSITPNLYTVIDDIDLNPYVTLQDN